MKRFLLALSLLVVSLPAFAQTCQLPPPDPIPRDALKLNWNAVTTWTTPPGGNIPTPTQVTYVVYKMASAQAGAAATKVCETMSVSAGIYSLPVGEPCYSISAKTPLSTPPNVEAMRTPTMCSTIQPPLTTPSTPTGFTITGAVQFNIVVTPTPPTP